MQYRLYRAGVHEITGTIAQCVQHIRERNPSLSVDDDLIRTALQSYRFVTPTGLVYRIESTKTREELIHYADGMPFESAWRAYAGMVEGGECTMHDLQCIKPELYRMVESYFELLATAKKQFGKPLAERLECNDFDVLVWLECNSFEVIDDSRITVFRRGPVDVLLDDGQWRVIRYTANRARLIEYEMTFSPATPASIVVHSIQYSL